MKIRNTKRTRGAAMVEYALLVAGVTLISTAAVSVLGHKTAGLIGAIAAVLPGANAADNNPIIDGHIVEVAPDAGVAAGPLTGTINIDISTTGAGISNVLNTRRLDTNIQGNVNNQFDTNLIIDTGT